MGPLTWYDSAQVRMWIILNINNNAFHHLGKSQICAGADHYFRSSKPHSGKLWDAYLQKCNNLVPVAASMGCPGYPWISLWFQYFRIRRHNSPNPATYFDILLNNRTGVQLAGYPYDSKEMPPLVVMQMLAVSHSAVYISPPALYIYPPLQQ